MIKPQVAIPVLLLQLVTLHDFERIRLEVQSGFEGKWQDENRYNYGSFVSHNQYK